MCYNSILKWERIIKVHCWIKHLLNWLLVSRHFFFRCQDTALTCITIWVTHNVDEKSITQYHSTTYSPFKPHCLWDNMKPTGWSCRAESPLSPSEFVNHSQKTELSWGRNNGNYQNRKSQQTSNLVVHRCCLGYAVSYWPGQEQTVNILVYNVSLASQCNSNQLRACPLRWSGIYPRRIHTPRTDTELYLDSIIVKQVDFINTRGNCG